MANVFTGKTHINKSESEELNWNISNIFYNSKLSKLNAYIILNGSEPDVIGMIELVGIDFVGIKIQEGIPTKYIPFSSIANFWFEKNKEENKEIKIDEYNCKRHKSRFCRAARIFNVRKL